MTVKAVLLHQLAAHHSFDVLSAYLKQGAQIQQDSDVRTRVLLEPQFVAMHHIVILMCRRVL